MRKAIALTRRVRQRFCSHAFNLGELALTNIPVPDGLRVPEIYRHEGHKKRVSWPCAKCGRVFYGSCGLDISPKHGPILAGAKGVRS
jgi:hypothetical protein